MIYALWHGGSSYADGQIDLDLERFPSVQAAADAFRERREDGFRVDFPYVHRAPERVDTPAVDESATMILWFSDPTDERDPYPDRMLAFGPRGGVRVEVC